MATIVLVAGPPFGPPLWEAVQRRLAHHGHDVHVHSLVGAAPARDAPSAGLDGACAGLSAAVSALAEAPVVVGHGLAAPVVARLPSDAVAGLVLSNGPVVRLDPVSRALARACARPAVAARTVLQPALFQRWLWSSVGLRRLVVNPYVMGRDTVVAVTGDALGTGAGRRHFAAFMASLGEVSWPLPPAQGSPPPTLLVWGDDDRLYPPGDAEALRVGREDCDHIRIPGGRHLHVQERPWELADHVHGWIRARSSGARPA